MPITKRLSDAVRNTVKAHLKKGRTHAQISEDLKVSLASVYRISREAKGQKRTGASKKAKKPKAAAKGRAPVLLNDRVNDAVLLLRTARSEALRAIREGRQNEMSREQLLAALALDALERI